MTCQSGVYLQKKFRNVKKSTRKQKRYHTLKYNSPLNPFSSLSSLLQVNSILRNVASKLKYENEQLEALYERTAWKLEERTGMPGSSYDLFKKAVS